MSKRTNFVLCFSYLHQFLCERYLTEVETVSVSVMKMSLFVTGKYAVRMENPQTMNPDSSCR